MPTTDPYAQYAVNPSSAPPAGASSSSGSTDPYAQYAVGGGSAAPTPPPASADPYAQFAVGGPKPAATPAPAEQTDPNAPWYKKAWNWANTGLLSPDQLAGAEKWLGQDHIYGWEKGLNDLVSGLSSPLSIALTIGTLPFGGEGGLIESGGAAALREAGVAAPEIADAIKGSQIFGKALKAGKTTDEALQAVDAAGVSRPAFESAIQKLDAAGMTPESLRARGVVQQAGGALMRSAGLNPAQADRAARGVQALVDAGFTAQNVWSAAAASPKVLDALKDGDYDRASELAVQALGSGAFGYLGYRGLTADAGSLMDEARAKAGLEVAPTVENEIVKKNFGVHDADVKQAGRAEQLWAEDLRKQYKDVAKSPEAMHRVFNLMQAGGDENVLAARRNALEQAAGRATPPEAQAPTEETAAARGTEGAPTVEPNAVAPEPPTAEATKIAITPGMDDTRVRELIGEQNVAQKYTGPELDRLLDSYDPSKITDQERALAAEVRNHFDETLQNAQAHGALNNEQAVQDYVTHLWDKDADNPAANKLVHQARMGDFSTYTPMARERIFSNAFEGQLLGKKLAVTDPIALAAHNGNSFARVIAARDALARLQDTGARAADGRPIVAPAGTGSMVMDPDGNNPAALVNPYNMRNIRIADQVVQGLKSTGDLDRMLADGRIVELQGKDGATNYAWNPSDYKTIDHSAMRGWNYGTTAPDGTPVLVKSDLRVHPEAYDYLNKRLGMDRSPLAENGIGKALLGANREGKGLLLFGSPFHLFQEGLRAVMTGVSPFGVERWDLRNDPVLRTGVENGLTLGRDQKGVQDYQEGLSAGHSKLLSKVPGLSQAQTWLSDMLFNRYIPGLKARAYRSLVQRYASAYPDWTPTKVAEEAAADTNSRFGGINYRRMGRAAATQDIFRLAALAPDWVESEASFMARAFGSKGKIARTDMTRLALGMWGVSRVLNYLVSGQAHLEAPFGVAIKNDDGSEKVLSMRTMPTDILHALSDPGNFLSGRASPLLRSGVQAISGRDEYGRKVPTHNLAVNLLRSVAPIPAQTLAKVATGEAPELSNADQVEKAAGLTVYPYQTEAGKLAAQLASDRSSSGPVDPAQLARHQATIRFEDDLRDGKMSPQELFDLVQNGQLPVADAKSMMKNLQTTAAMPADLARLYVRASRLPARDFLNVWDSATSNEKAALTPLLLKKRQSYFKDAATKMTATERQADPTYNRLRQMFPTQAPF